MASRAEVPQEILELVQDKPDITRPIDYVAARKALRELDQSLERMEQLGQLRKKIDDIKGFMNPEGAASQDKPVSTVDVKDFCAGCAKSQNSVPERFRICDRCNRLAYCSKQCQTADWARHKVEECIPKVDQAEIQAEKAKIQADHISFLDWIGKGEIVDGISDRQIAIVDVYNSALLRSEDPSQRFVVIIEMCNESNYCRAVKQEVLAVKPDDSFMLAIAKSNPATEIPIVVRVSKERTLLQILSIVRPESTS